MERCHRKRSRRTTFQPRTQPQGRTRRCQRPRHGNLAASSLLLTFLRLPFLSFFSSCFSFPNYCLGFLLTLSLLFTFLLPFYHYPIYSFLFFQLYFSIYPFYFLHPSLSFTFLCQFSFFLILVSSLILFSRFPCFD